ncbi:MULTISPECIES: hypothetical protein [Pandoraea]|uniref:hypothetical protein n=1 Tax=Pandoraea TaxID=93217 RepID=UPI001F5DE711|nr:MULTISPECIES: hypothetical protein [Pandoraea]MCI3206574.1 hypothetical protein [Pandoraea sp. LA3]MDN4584602.1 hypothetical protein [Pandoraea capi]
MMKKYAIIENGAVVNVVLWDGETKCDAIPDDAVELPDGSAVSPGYAFDGANFIAPPAQPPVRFN